MPSDTVQGPQQITSGNSLTNALEFIVAQIIKGEVHTADVVRVVAVDAGGPNAPAGYVDVLPLVCQTDAENNTLQPTNLYKLPYSRLQGGIAALVIDPLPGDIGLAVYTKRDSANVRQEQENPVQPGSFRLFDQANGFYIGGFLNQKPEIWLELTQDKVATLHAPEKVIVNTKEVTINASEKMTVNSPVTRFNGHVEVRDNLSWGKEGTGLDGSRARITRGLDVLQGLDVKNGIQSSGGVTNTGGTMSSNGIVVEDHTHTCPHGGTSKPQ